MTLSKQVCVKSALQSLSAGTTAGKISAPQFWRASLKKAFALAFMLTSFCAVESRSASRPHAPAEELTHNQVEIARWGLLRHNIGFRGWDQRMSNKNAGSYVDAGSLVIREKAPIGGKTNIGVVLYRGFEFDRGASFEDDEFLEPCLAKDLIQILGLSKDVFGNYFGRMKGIHPDAPILPADMVRSYTSMRLNSVLQNLIDSHPNPFQHQWSIVGTPPALLIALRLAASGYAKGGGVPDVHVNIMGHVPKYTLNLLKTLGLKYFVTNPRVDEDSLSVLARSSPEISSNIEACVRAAQKSS